MHFADFEIHRLKLFDFDLSRQIVERDRKEGGCHLTLENLAQTAARSIVTENLDLVLVVVGRYKKRKSLNVVPMNVGNKQAEINRARPELVLESQTKFANSRPGIEDNELAVSAHLRAGGITTVTHCCHARNRNGATDSP